MSIKLLDCTLRDGGHQNQSLFGEKTIEDIGDDINDLEAMKKVGFVACPFDACKDVKELAHYISPIKGGEGVIRDVYEFLAND